MASDVKENTSENTDPLKIENVEYNPWGVESASVFLKYCCPECDYSHQNLDFFTDHALKRHNKSNILFQTIDPGGTTKIAQYIFSLFVIKKWKHEK